MSVSANVRSRATESSDDYLKAVLELSGDARQQVSAGDLATALNISRASVTKMLQKLSATQPPLLIYEKHHGVQLAEAGAERALEIVRHHRLIETFLHRVLAYPWDEVHDEAERLEHFISERFEERIAAKLGNPLTDPHGHLIPERSGALPARTEVRLSTWACGLPAVISSVSDRNPGALREMKRLGLGPGTPITVETGTRKAGLRVRIGEAPSSVLLSQSLAAGISVVARNENLSEPASG